MMEVDCKECSNYRGDGECSINPFVALEGRLIRWRRSDYKNKNGDCNDFEKLPSERVNDE